MSEITVVIPNYNGMKYLPECMTSLCERQENAPEWDFLLWRHLWIMFLWSQRWEPERW